MKKVDRRDFVKVVALASVSAAGRLPAIASGWKEVSHELAGGTADSRGRLDERFALTLHRVLFGDAPRFSEEFLLADVRPTAERRFTEFSGDTSGRYIGALATASRVFGIETPGLDELVMKAIALQKADGYFGSGFHFEKPTDNDMALLWGNGRLLVGLLEYHRWKPSDAVLASCIRLGDFLVRVSPLMLSKEIRDAFDARHFASSYICWTQQTEALANLYSVTKDDRYRKLAADIAAVIERRPGDHVHGYLTSLRGVMDLYTFTGEPQLLSQCETAWTEIVASPDSLITGGVPEGWSPNNHRTEGCAEVDWVRLNLSLWRATRKEKYLAMAERAIFNEFAFNQFATGDFGHRVYTETGLPAAGAVRAWWCCTLHGLRCFPDIHESAFHQKDGKLWLDLPIDGRAESPGLSLVSESSLAQAGTVRVRITHCGQESVFLGIRKPAWANDWEVTINGKSHAGFLEQPYVSFSRVWTAGDVVEVRFAMKLRSETNPTGRETFWFGPWLLGASATADPAYFNEMTAENQFLPGEPVREGKGTSAVPFSVPIAATEMRYAPAEYPDQPGTVTLRPIAEQTGEPSTSWEVRFLTRKRG